MQKNDIRTQRRKPIAWLIILLAALLLSAVIALMVGSVGPIGGSGISFRAFWDILTGNGGRWPSGLSAALIDSRLPRIALAALIGCALSSSGVSMQAIFRNPMADPYIIGISSGAALGATFAVFLPGALSGSYYALPVFAFAGAAGAVFLVYGISRGAGGCIRTETLLLTGIAVGSFLSAVTTLIMYLSGKQFNFLWYWLLGGISSTSWDAVWICAGPIVGGVIVLQLFARDLNAMSLGEETALSLGIRAEDCKKIVLIISAVLAGTAVAFAGIVGFVGLIIPHMVRIVSGPDHRLLLPAATVAGGLFLIWADTAARTAIAPAELPLGIVTALCGAPLFAYLLWRSR